MPLEDTVVDLSPWPAPEPLPDQMRAVPLFDLNLLPHALRGWVADVAERMQCPVDYCAVAVMVALSATVGRQVAVRPRQHDDWTVIPNLWGAIVGPPGIKKSPPLRAMLTPLEDIERRLQRDYEDDRKAYEASLMAAQEFEKARKVEMRKAYKLGDKQKAHDLALDAIDEKPTEPPCPQRIVNDFTVEKLGVILNQNPRGVLLFRDELMGFLKGMERQGHEQDRAFHLECWAGDGRYVFDRIGRGKTVVDGCCESVIGGIQPGPLNGYFRARKKDIAEDGLLQRFQLLVYPDVSPDYQDVDREPNHAARQAAEATFNRLDSLNVSGLEVSESGLPFLRFSPDGQTVFREWHGRLERRNRTDTDPEAFRSHLSKYASLVPSLALLIHLADEGISPVSAQAVSMAIRWADYLEAHARRIYADALEPEMAVAHLLAAKIQAGALTSPFTKREVARKQWSGLTKSEDIMAALRILTEYHQIRPVDRRPLGPDGQPQGRPTVDYEINPGAGR